MVYIILAVVAVLGIGALAWFLKARKDKKIPESKLAAPLPEEDESDVVLVKAQKPKPVEPAPAPKPEPPKPAPAPRPEPPKPAPAPRPEPPKPAPAPRPEPPKPAPPPPMPEIKAEITFDADDMALDESAMGETMEVQLEREGLEDIPDDAVEVVLDAEDDEDAAPVVEPEQVKPAAVEKKAAKPASAQAANPSKGAAAAKKAGGDDQEKFAAEVDNELDALFGDDK
jgi:hypothetical protein